MSNNVAANKSETQDTNMTKFSQPSSLLFLDQLDVDVSGTIVVMIGRMWDVSAITKHYLSTDFVVSDSKGNMIHCTAKGNIAHNFLRLKEGGIYSIKNFAVHPNKDDFRVVKHVTFMLKFDGATTIRNSSVSDVGFLRYPFQLVDFDRIKATNNKYLIGMYINSLIICCCMVILKSK
ncbi:putative zinc finger, CCHC-type containing protein [Tanacetum coccineum]